MIVLVKLFNKESYKDGTEYGAAKPFAIYEEDSFTILTSDEDYFKHFPNTGNIFVPYKNNREQIFALYQLSESNTFEPDRPTSNKYMLSKEVLGQSFYELVDLFYSLETDFEKITEILRKGLPFDYSPKNDVVFRTKDGYLIGPVRLIENEVGYGLKNTGFVPYYKGEVNSVTIFDDFNRKNRTFFVYEFVVEDIKGNFDLADDKTILSFVLQHLKLNTELGEMSRKLRQNLSNWLTAPTIEEANIIDRFNRVIELIDNQALDEGFLKKYTNQLFSLELTKTIIEQNTSRKFDEEYNKFVKENKSLINETKSNKILFNECSNKLNDTEMRLANAQKLLNTIEQTFHQKIQELQTDYSKVYANELLNAPIALQTKVQNLTNISVQGIYNNFSSEKGTHFQSLEDVFEGLKVNLKKFKARDPKNILPATIISAILLEQPLVITGKYSLELAQCLTYTIASEETLVVIPELESFGLNQLESLFKQYECEQNVKTLILHNVHLTSAQYTLPVYLKQLKWLQNSMNPNLQILTIENENDAEELLSTMGEIPIIDSEEFILSSIRKSQVQQLSAGQLITEDIESYLEFNDVRGIYKEFINWYLDNNTEIDELELTMELTEWLQYYTNILGSDDGYIAFSKVFNKYLLIYSDEF
ncbi:hypothetical protein P4562_21490 [Lysinibacillus xylanilyticus]|uniref:hypothetical protein n=1 Tax=Lysinibacillus xylanilyticus TaxID=582475 RepID=UPI002E1BB0A6|nr:hypothetical protein [Lysinibacillus xylanilyticus]